MLLSRTFMLIELITPMSLSSESLTSMLSLIAFEGKFILADLKNGYLERLLLV